jgi:uncharacterized membrane protein
MGFKKTLLMAMGLFMIWLLCISIPGFNLHSRVRIFNDFFDRSVYALRGEWYLKGQVPFRDTISEYPQIPTYIFAVPYLFGSREKPVNFWVYSSIFSFIMLCFLFATVNLLYSMLLGNKTRVILMLLPAALYFTYNRFDIMPSFITLFALSFLQRKQTVIAGIVLSVATLTKWYSGLLLPIFIVYVFYQTRRLDWKMILAFILTSLIIITPTLLAGGVNAVLSPYLLHANRGLEFVSLPALIQNFFLVLFGLDLNINMLIYIPLALSFLPLLFSLIIKIDSFDKVIHWSILVIAFFIIFSRIWSPQWLLWLLPLMILSARTKLDIAWIIAYDLLSYLAFPIIFDLAGPGSFALKAAGLANYIVLIRLVIVSYQRADAALLQRLALLWRAKNKCNEPV